MIDLLQLASSPLLHGLAKGQVHALAGIGRDLQFDAGEHVFLRGDPANTLYLIKTGVVELSVPVTVLGVTTAMVVAQQRRGDTLAWSTLVEPYRLTMSAKAKTDVALFGFARPELVALCEAQPDLGFAFMRNFTVIVGRRLAMTDLTLTMSSQLKRGVSKKYP